MKEKSIIDFKERFGPWAIVTGASSGFGEEFCKQLAALGLNIVLIARREERLIKLSAKLTNEFSIETRAIKLDLSKDDFLRELILLTNDLDIGLLINNAGFAITGNFLSHPIDDQLKLLNVNIRAMLILTHYFGNLMADKRKGGIINLSSASAFLPIPGWANYASTKSFILHFSEALQYELKEKKIDLLAFCPGATRTEFSNVANTKWTGDDVSKVTAAALNSLGKKTLLITGAKNKIFIFMIKLLPHKFITFLGAKALQSMKKEKS